MKILSFCLKQFRNYSDLHLVPATGRNVFIGRNAQGKSNVLEALYCLSNTRSFRTAKNIEMIQWEKSLFCINGTVRTKEFNNKIKIVYSGKKKVSL